MWRCFPAVVILCLASASRAKEPAEVRAVIEKALQAHGGKDKLAAIKAETWKTEGVTQSGDALYTETTEWFVQGAAQVRKVSELNSMGKPQRTTRMLDGDRGLITTLINGQMLGYKVKAVWIAEEQEQNYSRRIASLQPFAREEKGYKLSSLGESKVDGKVAVGILVSSKDHRDVKLFFDRTEGFLLKTEYAVMHVSGVDVKARPEIKQEVFYSDYKEFGGYKRPKKMTITFNGVLSSDCELIEYKCVEKLEDELFRR